MILHLFLSSRCLSTSYSGVPASFSLKDCMTRDAVVLALGNLERVGNAT